MDCELFSNYVACWDPTALPRLSFIANIISFNCKHAEILVVRSKGHFQADLTQPGAVTIQTDTLHFQLRTTVPWHRTLILKFHLPGLQEAIDGVWLR